MNSSNGDTSHDFIELSSDDSSEKQLSNSTPPPLDAGRHAWMVLFACFIVEVLAWSYTFAYGVFEAHYMKLPQLSGNPAAVSAIGTTATGIMYFSGPIVSITLRRWPQHRRKFIVGGLITLVAGLIAASFATTVPQLLLTQGVLCGIGGGLLYFSGITLLDEWFFNRRSLAYGIVWAGSGLGGVFTPLVLEWLLSTFGSATALRVWATVTAVVTAPLIFFLKPRLPPRSRSAGNDLHLLKNGTFWLLQSTNTIMSLGYFLPALWLPTFATRINLSRFTGALAVALQNAAMVPGAIIGGFLVDHQVHVTTVQMISAVGSAVAILVLWGLATTKALLLAFPIAYGFFVAAHAATWAGCAPLIRKHMETEEKAATVEANSVVAMLAAGRGIGAVVSGPLSTKLLDAATSSVSHLQSAYSTGYGSLIVFAGTVIFFGGACWPVRRLGRL